MKISCPICEEEAEDITLKTFDGITIRCKSCGDFDISDSVWAPGALAGKNFEQRIAALNNARREAVEGRRPMIRDHNIPN